LRLLRPLIEENAKRMWKEAAGARSIQSQCSQCTEYFERIGNPVFVPRVLDVQKGQLCYVVGTVYMDMPLKPNILDDIARDVRPSHLYIQSPGFIRIHRYSMRYQRRRHEKSTALKTTASCSKTSRVVYASLANSSSLRE
jgi:hypothetical protein